MCEPVGLGRYTRSGDPLVLKGQSTLETTDPAWLTLYRTKLGAVA